VYHLTRQKYWFFLISLIVILPGVAALIGWGLNLGIDFTGGDIRYLRFAGPVTVAEIQSAYQATKAQDVKVYVLSDAKGSTPAQQYAFITFNHSFGKAEEASVMSLLADPKYNLPNSTLSGQNYVQSTKDGETGMMVVIFDKPVTTAQVEAALKTLPPTDAPPVGATGANATPTVAATATAAATATSYATATAVPTASATAKPGATATPAPTATATATPNSATFPIALKSVTLGSSAQIYEVQTQTFLTDINQAKVIASLTDAHGPVYQVEQDSANPSLAQSQTLKAVAAVALASLAILLYVGIAFRRVGGWRAFRFGASAIIALLHDVLVVLGLWAIFGHFFGFKVDTVFLTAILTVIGFSVHDTIVVFDRIRENLSRRTSESFETIVDASLIQTMSRSLNTSLTVLFTLAALTLFGGDSVREFTLALLIGIASGTYSSIFNASMILVVWEKKEYRNWIPWIRARLGGRPAPATLLASGAKGQLTGARS
jgi:preprotein translocase SecF subunit